MKKNKIFAILLCVCIASIPLLMDYLVNGHDLEFHLIRIEAIYNGLKNGVFPVKMQDIWFDNHGYPVGVFYGDWLLYIPVLFRFLGCSIQLSYQIFVLLINLITAIVSYYCFKRLFENDNIGVLGCYLYTLSLYRLENVYSRAAVGEYCAMIFLPLVFLGMYEVLFKNNKNTVSSVGLLVLGLTGLIHSHTLSCEMVAIFIILTCVVFIKRVLQPRIFLQLCLVVVITLLLSLDFIVPFIDYYLQDYVLVTSDSWIWRIIPVQDLGLFFNQIFSVFIKPYGQSVGSQFAVSEEITFSLGLPVIIGMVIYGYYFINLNKEDRQSINYKIGLYSFILFLVSVLMSSRFFPWTKLSSLNDICLSLISSLQFPWRFLIFSTLFSTVFICAVSVYFEGIVEEEYKYLPVAAIGISLLISVATYSNALIFDAEPEHRLYCYSAEQLNVKKFDAGEYLPETTVGVDLNSEKIIVSESTHLNSYLKDGLSVNCNVSTDFSGGYIEIPLLNYKGYSAYDLNTNTKFKITNGENNVIRINLPANYTGNIKVCFIEPIYWRIAEIITLCSIMVLLVHTFVKLKKHWRKNENNI